MRSQGLRQLVQQLPAAGLGVRIGPLAQPVVQTRGVPARAAQASAASARAMSALLRRRRGRMVVHLVHQQAHAAAGVHRQRCSSALRSKYE